DLRRPKINKIFRSENLLGLSSYLINQATIDDIIQQTEIPNLDLITAGPAAPNPAELMSSERTRELIDMLKEMYDIIIIDSAPVGIISETFHLMQLSDHTVFVVRQNYSVKEMVDNTIHRLKQNKIENFAILFNDVNVKKDSYRYGYNKTYYTDDKKQGPLKRLFGG
ncbi:MAG: CpsD/CapB family tyrosine-protein kinase, partial [Bacteroidota bacterium]